MLCPYKFTKEVTYMKKVRIAVLGSLIYDCVFRGPRLPRKGETVAGFANGFFTGGKGANQAVQAAKLGAEVYMIGKLGRDLPGDTLLKALKSYGVHTDYIKVDENEGTGTCGIFVDTEGDNMIMTSLAGNMTIRPDEIEEAIGRLDEFDVFLTQLETSMESIDHALAKAKKASCKVIFNTAPGLAIPDEFISGVDFVTPNETEAEAYTGIVPSFDDRKGTREAAEKLRAKGAKGVVFTLGKQGSYYFDGEKEIYAPSHKIDPVDATAAGDAFNAAFSVMCATGETPERALTFANAAGGLAASRAGAQPSIGTLDEITAFLKERGIDFF